MVDGAFYVIPMVTGWLFISVFDGGKSQFAAYTV
jgi:hypothetical protein